MTTPDELLRLAERVEQGSGFDIDSDVCEVFPDVYGYCVVELTTSIDDVEALRERLLPGSLISSSNTKGDWIVNVWASIALGLRSGRAKTEPRGRLAALLRAVAAKEA